MNHRVSVYQQTKNVDYSSASRSQNVIAINWGSSISMTWQQFLRKYIIWFAAKVLGEQHLGDVDPFGEAPAAAVEFQQLQIAVKAISSIPDVDYFDNLYYDYIKRDDVLDLGYYCKDNWPVPIAIKVSGKRNIMLVISY